MYMNKHNQKTNCHAIYTYIKHLPISNNSLDKQHDTKPTNKCYIRMYKYIYYSRRKTHKDNNQHNVYYPLKEISLKNIQNNQQCFIQNKNVFSTHSPKQTL